MGKRWKVGSILAFCFLTITLPFLLSGCGLIDYLIGDLPGDIPYDQIKLPNGDLVQYDIFDTICDESMVSWKSERGFIAYSKNNKWHFPSASNPGGEAEEWLNPEVVNVGFEDKEDWDFSDVFLYLNKETTTANAHIHIKLFNAEADCLDPTFITFQSTQDILEYEVVRDRDKNSEQYLQLDYPITISLFPNNTFIGNYVDIFINKAEGEIYRNPQVGDIIAVDYVEGEECDLPLPPDPNEDYSYDHTGIIVNDGTYNEARVIESTGGGVREIALSKFVNDREAKCDVGAIEIWRVDAPSEVKGEAARIASSSQFIDADFTSLLDITQKGQLDGSYYCSELAWIVYQMGWHSYKDTEYEYERMCYAFLDADDEGQSYLGGHCGWNEPVTPSDMVYSQYTTLGSLLVNRNG